MPKIVDADQNREMIARAACRAIAAKGIGTVTLRDIAAEAGATTGMILNYFDNKDDILAAALRQPFAAVRASVEAQIAAGTNDLATILDCVIPATAETRADVAVWVGFWGTVATDAEAQTLNRALHAEALAVYDRAMAQAWPETRIWARDVHDTVRRGIVTFLFGLNAGGVTNPTAWPPQTQRSQLGLYLDLIRDWGNAQPQ